ncbi:MAG: hypothetical protein HY914_23400 [Desulfomonile tiedjei]|nr:hypothetical protein [Desulfomonile tiedjei]
MKKDVVLARLRRVLRSVFSQPVPMTILTNPEIKTYTPEEVSKVVLDTYLMALSDVQDYIEGETLTLEELLTTDGKAVVVDTSQKIFVFPVPKEDIISRDGE